MKFKIFCIFTLLLSTINIGIRSEVAQATSCDDLKVIFARGSGESLNGPSFNAWQSEITAELGHTSLKYSFYELGSASQGGYLYPAVSVSGGFDGASNLLGAFISRGSWFEFGDSVRAGANELKTYLSGLSHTCPDTKVVLGGYSQGAMVISSVLDTLDADDIIYVATFGDPKLYLPEGQAHNAGRIHKLPDACSGKNLSEYREYVPDCHAYEGVLGSFRPYQPSQYSGKVGVWCNLSDIMCSSGLSIDDHTAYISSNLYRDAAVTIARKVRQQFADRFNTIISAGRLALHEVAIVIDTTSSMSSMISAYKNEAQKLATSVKSGGGRVALFEYRDLKEDFVPTELCDFSCTVDELNSQISGLKTKGGGDTNESALSAISVALDSLDWSNGATKSIVLLTDAGYHDPDYDPAATKLSDVVKRSLEIDPVNIYVVTNSGTKSEYAELTTLTGGQVFDIATGLELSTETILARPVARLPLSYYEGKVGETFTFDASGSYDQAGNELLFDWDLDGDGAFEKVGASSRISTTFTSTFDDYIQVRVRSLAGTSSTMSARVVVRPTDYTYATPAIISNLNIKQSDGGAKISFTTDADQVLLLVDNAPLGFIFPESGRADFTLTELAAKTSVTLVPYRLFARGTSTSFDLSTDAASLPISTSLLPVMLGTLPTKAPNTGVRG